MKSVLKDMTNTKHNRLFVESRAENRKKKIASWNCICDCGSRIIVDGSKLRNGSTKSCGCYKRENTSRLMTTHGHHRKGQESKTYITWRGMIDRATNHRHKTANCYILRGITVCDRWLKFENFLSDMGERPEGKEIDRIDNNKGYEPANCQWVTHKENCNNQGRSIKVDFNGYQVSFQKLLSVSKIPRRTLLRRLTKYKWDVSKAMLTPCSKGRRYTHRIGRKVDSGNTIHYTEAWH